ncbi:MAG: efflux RND transporter periplasmic adaptor subunit [Gammaproteobacteria bacterium]|nr:efflux RND transporter periplasmic adaptor subunit [Gammaproteobacteria bacterium]MYI77367.1 efflux RND transporter periplasmic adaptor subunit [Gammaproteobacteria bacterium]
MTESKSSLEDKVHGLRIDRSSSTGKSSRPWLVFLVIAVIAGPSLFAGYWFFLSGRGVVEVEAVVVRIATPQALESTVLEGTGYVVARRQTTVSSKTTGRVATVYVEEGMLVENNQLLATLDDSRQQTTLELALAQVEEIRASIDEIDVRIKQSQLDLERVNQLVVEAMVSQDEVDQTRLRLDGFVAQKQRLEKSVDVAQKNVTLREQELEDTNIRAPFKGVVIAKAAQPGEMISPVSAGGGFTRTGICTIVDMDSIEVQVDVNEKYINRVSPGQPATVTLVSYPETQLPAQVIAIIPTADRARSTVRVRIAFLERDSRVLPDMAVKVSFFEEGTTLVSNEDTPLGADVPQTAVVVEDGQHYVWLIEQDTIHRKSVEVLTRTPTGLTRLVNDFERGARVVRNLSELDFSKFESGMRVKIAN